MTPTPTPRRSTSLLNFETVKYFNAETRETERYDRSMARYERRASNLYITRGLNAGQAVIFTLGLTAVMIMCVDGIKSGTKTVGDFVLINAMMIQLYQPLNFMGVVYREIRQAASTSKRCSGHSRPQSPEIEDTPGCAVRSS